ncbi:hypothetical protein C0995_007588 [Termitomyces sp. Mi166|nr:hypothetical protein C0995_007588 [Termitomyces sp. Mi166\
MALTATATPEYDLMGRIRRNRLTVTQRVQNDIIRSLHLSEDRLYHAIHPFNRVNLFYEVPIMSKSMDLSLTSYQVQYFANFEPVSQMAQVCEYITTLYRRRKRPSSGVIYCRKRATCDELSRYLRTKGINSQPYHRGVSPHTLDKTLREWTIGGTGEGGIDVVVATIAFGLGIDKPDVRYIIHYDVPKSFEGYYQETGASYEHAMHHVELTYCYAKDALDAMDLHQNAYFITDAREVQRWVNNTSEARLDQDGPPPSQRAKHSIAALFEFAENVEICRHVSICRYFGEEIDEKDAEVLRRYCNNMCDVCKYPEKTRHRVTKLSTEVTLKVDLSMDMGCPRAALVVPAVNRLRTNVNITGVRGQQALSGVRSYGTTKRAVSEHDRQTFGTSVKKAKVSQATILVTKPHASASGLRKPFKTPFRTPFIEKVEKVDPPPLPSPPKPSLCKEMGAEASDDHIKKDDNQRGTLKKLDADRRHECIERETTMKVPDIATELEVSFSGKIPMDARLKGFNNIRRALYCILMPHGDETWNALGAVYTTVEAREKLICIAAKELEFSSLSMSSTQNGYTQRVDETVTVIGTDVRKLLLGGPSCTDDDDDDDAQVVAGLLRKFCRNHFKSSG